MNYTGKDFGPDFKWGVSTAAYQTEGGWDSDGKGNSIWDVFANTKGKTFQGDNGNVACDFYRRYTNDIILMAMLKIPNFRFSLSWSRIIPLGNGKVNPLGIEFYNRVIDFCFEMGIEPWITLYHWDLPYELEKRGVDVMIDGAHALGSIPLDLQKIGAAYYTANCHKWLCAPKSAAILHVRSDKQAGIVPVIISHAGHKAEPFTERFFWPGTYDPTAAICVADSIAYMESIFPGGWPAIMKRNHALCLEARDLICTLLQIDKPCPDPMVASMATIPLRQCVPVSELDYKDFDPLQEFLSQEYNIEIPVWNWPLPSSKLARISVQLYNSMDQYRFFTSALMEVLKPG